VEVVRTYLTLDDPAQLVPPAAAPDVRFELRRPCPLPLYRALYREVGEPWFWHERLHWPDERLAGHLARESVAVWEAMTAEGSAGYFELQRHDDGSVEIAYFGLRPRFIGRGIGGAMLARAVREGFAMGGRATRVWLHTCTLDSEHALPSYLARGFRPYRTERLEVEIEGGAVVSERRIDEGGG